jgi:hypothetical protein
MEVRRPVVAGDDRLAVDQERRCLDAERSINDGREAHCGSTKSKADRADKSSSVNIQPSLMIHRSDQALLLQLLRWPRRPLPRRLLWC